MSQPPGRTAIMMSEREKTNKVNPMISPSSLWRVNPEISPGESIQATQ